MVRAWLFAFVLLFAACASAQSLAVMPGLWENVVYDDAGKPSVTALDCVTPTSFAEMMSKAASHPGCKISSQNMNSHGMTVDISCATPKVQMNSHGVLEVVDSEHVRSTTTIKMTVGGKTNESTAKAAAHFKSPSCGDIKPGDPKITSE